MRESWGEQGEALERRIRYRRQCVGRQAIGGKMDHADSCGIERREPGLFCEPAEDYDKTSNHQWRTVSIIDDA